MNTLRIAGATLNQTPLDWTGNRQRIADLLKEAHEKQVQVVCFPELSISGYNCEDMFFSLHTLRQAEASLSELLPHIIDCIAIIGLPIYYQGAVYNAVAVVQNGKIVGVNPKKVLPRDGVHYEGRWFKPWPAHAMASITLCGQTVPFGDAQYRFGEWRMAVEICEEAWGAVPGATAHAQSGVELVVNPSASHFALGKIKTRETLVANNSRSLQVHYLYTNLMGLEEGRVIYDGGVIVADCGTITHRGPRFSFCDGTLTFADIDLEKVRSQKTRTWSESADLRESLVEAQQVVMGHPVKKIAKTSLTSKVQPSSVQFPHQDCEHQFSEQQDFLVAEAMALWDYLRKSRAKGFVVSLSGGCDSAAVAVLIGHMMALALQELGPETVAKRLGLVAPQKDAHNPRVWLSQVLTVVYQATSNSGVITENAASQLAQALGADYHRLNIQELVDGYLDRAQVVLGRPLNWQQDDLALQNIQARARAPMIWLIANVKRALLVATSNRSEAAVGYATMDGDTAGGISPLAGIDKHFLREWLQWAEFNNHLGLGTLSALSAVNNQDPTAELRPSTSHQTDEADLMPYPVLARIERLLIRDRLAPFDIWQKLSEEFPHIEGNQIRDYVVRFLKLWSQNQWKRERFAPGFQLDDESLDPKTWCRFPILSGGFQVEIAQLQAVSGTNAQKP